MNCEKHCCEKTEKALVAYEPTTKLGKFTSTSLPTPNTNVRWGSLNSAQRGNAIQITAESPSTITAGATGMLYVSMSIGPMNSPGTTGTVYRFDPAGLTPTDIWPPLSIPPSPWSTGDSFRGIAYNAFFDRLFLLVGSASNPRVLTFKEDGSDIQTYASFDPLTTTGFVNDLVFDSKNNMYVTDSGTFSSPSPNAKGKIYFVPFNSNYATLPAMISTYWSTDPLLSPNVPEPFRFTGANGIVLNSKGDTLYVGVTETGAIVKISILSDGSAGTGKIFVQDPLLKMNDGMKMDSRGNIWVSVGSSRDAIVKVSPQGKMKVIADTYPVFDYPSSFHIAKDTSDMMQIFVVNSSLFRNAAVNTSSYVSGTPNQHIGLLTITYQ